MKACSNLKTQWILLIVLACMAVPAATQDPPKIELTGDYSYLRFNPSLPQLQNQVGELARRIKGYEDALWENDAVWRL